MANLKIKFTDYIIVGAILLLGASGFWFNLQQASAAEYKYAIVYVENQQVAELSLTPGDQFNYSFKFGEDDKNTALVEIDDGRVRMLPLDDHICPKHICSHTGWIEYSYQSIVCLPNQIMIVFSETMSGSADENLDGLTY